MLILAAMTLSAWADDAGRPLGERHFEFTYEASLANIPEGAQTIDFWAPIARDLPEQEISLDETTLPEGATIATDETYGNEILHIRWEAPFPDNLGIALKYEVNRREVFSADAKSLAPSAAPEPSPLFSKHLGPTAMIPLEGKMSSIADELGLKHDEPIRTGRTAYDYVVDLMTYGKDTPGWGRGDVLWACDSRTGNCSDFHSVFMGLTRAREIPSYFEIGFPLPPDTAEGEIGGYHCWAWFHGGDAAGWIPVDASEADKHPELFEYYFGALTVDRVAFSQGRDLTLVPAQQGEPLNFLIYPYVEIDGAAGGTVNKRFTFRDLN
jgi:transglutaminase-like putative cysteine protease